MPKTPNKKADTSAPKEKIFDFSVHRGEDGRILASWRFDKKRAEDAAKNTIQEKGSDLIGSLFDLIKNKITGANSRPEEDEE